MKLLQTVFAAGLVFLAGSLFVPLLPAQEQTNSPTPPKLNREELREQLKGLSPSEREAKLKELREKYSTNSPERALWDKRREELKNLSPEQREAKIREWRMGTNAPAPQGISAEERQARLKVILARMQEQADNLRKKKADKTIAPEDEKRLERMDDMIKRFEKEGGIRPLPAPAPKPDKSAGEK